LVLIDGLRKLASVELATVTVGADGSIVAKYVPKGGAPYECTAVRAAVSTAKQDVRYREQEDPKDRRSKFVWCDKNLDVTEVRVKQLVLSGGMESDPTRPGTVRFMLGKNITVVEINNDKLSKAAVGLMSTGDKKASGDPKFADEDDGDDMGRIRVLGVCALFVRDSPLDTPDKIKARVVEPYVNRILIEGRARGGGLNAWIPNVRRANRLLTPVVPLSTSTEEELQIAKDNGAKVDSIEDLRADRANDLAGQTVIQYLNDHQPGPQDLAAAIHGSKAVLIF
jgi:hypothetical protein